MTEALAYPDADVEEQDEEAPAAEQGEPWVLTAPESSNLAFDIDETILGKIGAKVCEEYTSDLTSRGESGFDLRLKRAVALATMATEAKTSPWENASNVKYPLIIQAAIQFNARSYAAVVDGPDVVKGSVKGKPDPEKDARADRVGKHMSWQLLEEEEEWEEDTDQMLLRLAVVGTLVRKRYFDPILGRTCSHVLGPDEFVVNYMAKRDLRVCPRATHVLRYYPHEILENRRSGLWLDIDLGDAPDAANDDEAPHAFLEQHRLWDLDGDGYPEPYIVTVHQETQKVVRLVARWYPQGVQVNQRGEIAKITPYECFTKYGFIPSADGSFYDMGFGTLLGSTADSIDTILNQLIDAGTLANLQGGFIGEGVSIKSGRSRFAPGEWKKAGSTGASLRESIVPLNYKEPSTVLFSLMTFLIDAAKEITATQDILTGDAGKGTMPVGTVQALVEQGLKTFTAIVKRIHRSFRRELAILYQLNGRYLDPQVYFTFQDEPAEVLRDDYQADDLDVIPVSDPNMATDLQRMGQAQFVLSLIETGEVDKREAVNRALAAAHVPDRKALEPKGSPPPDPKTLEVAAKAEDAKRNTDIKAATAAADIAAKEATTEKTKLETALMGPEVMAFIQQVVQASVQQALTMVNNGGQVQPDQLQGMGGPPVDPGLLPPPEGMQGPPGGPMGEGGEYVPGPADQSLVPTGALDPQLV